MHVADLKNNQYHLYGDIWIYNIKLTEGVGVTLLIEDDREGRKMLERKDKTDATDSDRVRLDGESSELIADGVPATGMLVDLLLWLGIGSPSLDSTRMIS
jgi:hypothetical protein